jgi:aryl-alcohol dehydrogenase-like predicted oxidoreductase
MSVDRLILGTLHLCVVPPREAFRVLDAFVESGGHAIDTAPYYGGGYVESLVGDWLRHTSARVRVSTKLGHLDTAAAYRDGSALRHALEASMERLALVPDVVLLHEGDWACWWEPGRRVGEVDAATAEWSAPAWTMLQTIAGALGFQTGLSGNNAGQLRTAAVAVRPRYIMVAKQYDLLWRSAEPLLTWAGMNGVQVWAAAPLHQGALLNLRSLAGECRTAGDVELESHAHRLRSLLGRWQLSVVDVAVPFVLADPRIAHLCVGARSAEEIRALVASADRTLPDDLLGTLKCLGVIRPPRPGPAGQVAYRSPQWRTAHG